MKSMQTFKGRPTLCLVDLDALCWNFRQIREKIGASVKILSMVKANAYGHGAPAVAAALAAQGSDAFGVATLEEGIELRRAGIRQPVLVLAGAYLEQIEQFLEHRLIPVIHDPHALKTMEAAVRSRGSALNVHLKIDSGMGRIGLLPQEMPAWLPLLKKLTALKVEGVFSHFSHAESIQGNYTQKQLGIFQSMIGQLRAAGIMPPLVHLANSAATLTCPAAHFDMVRPGLILYGIYPSAEMTHHISLRPVLSWKTRILQLKKVPAATSISYGQTFVTARESLIATLPIGYADGYSRMLSNRGQVLIQGKRAPIRGRVCMDLTMVDLTDIGNPEQEAEVVLLGSQGGELISADEMAGWSGTISYEILTSISARVPRIHYHSQGG